MLPPHSEVVPSPQPPVCVEVFPHVECSEAVSCGVTGVGVSISNTKRGPLPTGIWLLEVPQPLVSQLDSVVLWDAELGGGGRLQEPEPRELCLPRPRWGEVPLDYSLISRSHKKVNEIYLANRGLPLAVPRVGEHAIAMTASAVDRITIVIEPLVLFLA